MPDICYSISIFAEILSSKIKDNNLLHRFTKINFQDEIKNVQYADDMTVTLGEIESMKHAIDTIYKIFNYM